VAPPNNFRVLAQLRPRRSQRRNGADDLQHFLPDEPAKPAPHNLREPKVSTLFSHTFGFGPQSARYQAWKRCDMTTLVIVLVVLFLLGGGGWGYSRWRG
jgi:hypothetical protein